MFDPRAQTVADNAFEAEVGDAMGALNAVAAQLVDLVRRSIEASWWERSGCRSPEHWVSACCGVGPNRAHRLVAVARGLADFPLVAERFRGGQLTEDQVHLIVAIAHPSQDDDLSWTAPAMNTSQLARVLRLTRRQVDDRLGEAEAEAEAPDAPAPEPADELFAGWGDDGRYRGRFDLGPGLGALWEKSIAAARSRLFTERSGRTAEDDPAGASRVTGADALERLCHGALGGLDPATARGQRPGDRYQVIIHLEADNPGRARLHLGPTLSTAERELLTCDADVRLMVLRRGLPFSKFRRRRLADPVLRALIEDRDGGCRVDGCGRRGFLHLHHLVHWADGGPTTPDNLVALCTEHHRAVHRGELRIVGDPTKPDGLVFLDREGRSPPSPRPEWRDRPPSGPAPYSGPDRSERLRLSELC